MIVMVKEPRPGQVKTRLGQDIGAVGAAWWFRRQTAALLRRIRDPRWAVVLAVSPDRTGLLSRVWPKDLPRIPQGRGDLGQRMARALDAMPPGPALVIGADIPGVDRTEIWSAFRALGRAQSVVGPAEDGGYWLVGLRRTGARPQRLFKGVRWSSEHALADTLQTLPPPLARVSTLRDVDTAADLDYLRRRRTS